MGKTHEALERADKTFEKYFLGSPDYSHKAVAAKIADKLPTQTLSGRFQEVKTKLLTRFPLGSVKTLLFAGAALGDGCTTTAISFATTMAQNCRLNVLLVDANLRSPSLHELFDTRYSTGLTDLLTSKEENISLFKKMRHENLYLIPCGNNHSGPLAVFESTRFDDALKLMREMFDFVILDAPPAIGFAETKVMATKVDGVILVIKSGKTRRHVASRVKQEMEEVGAKILGVILNRRKYYIPEWIYRRL